MGRGAAQVWLSGAPFSTLDTRRPGITPTDAGIGARTEPPEYRGCPTCTTAGSFTALGARGRVRAARPQSRPLRGGALRPGLVRIESSNCNARSANSTVGLLVQRTVPADRLLLGSCLARNVFQAMSDADLVATIAAVDRLEPEAATDADRRGLLGNRQEARREQARRRFPGFEAGADGVRAAASPAARRVAVEQLVTWVRSQIDTYPALVARYRRQAAPEAEEKVRVLGEAAAAVARLEFLLGTVLHRGGSWESGANSGPMVDDYTGGNAQAWSSRFATAALQEIRGDGLGAGSGYKLANPDQFASVDIDYDADQGGALVGTRSSRNATSANNPFVELRRTLEAIEDGTDTTQTAEQAAATFLRDQIRPQAGDVVVVRRGTANPNSFAAGSLSHTLMVESVSGARMSLIEGNAGAATDRVTGRVLDLTSVEDVEELVFISRPSLTSGLSDADAALVGAGGDGAEPVTESEIVTPLADLNLLVEELARAEGDVTTGATGGSVAELVGNT